MSRPMIQQPLVNRGIETQADHHDIENGALCFVL